MSEFPKIVSVDDHVVEPPDTWSSRLPKKYADVGPRIVYAPVGEVVVGVDENGALIFAAGGGGSMPRLDQASTDSNIPISLKIPAVTLGAGGTGSNSHTLDEWYDPRGRDAGLKRALVVILGMVGLQK